LPITAEAAETIRKSLASGSPAVFDPQSGNKVDDVAAQFSVLSQMMMAVHPKSGKPWMFGMHQCSCARVWTADEQRLFKEISYRVVEGLNNLILLRDLKQSEHKYRNLLENLPQRIFHKDRNSIYVSCNTNFARDLKIDPDTIAGTTDYDYFPRELAEKYVQDDRKVMESGQTEDIVEKYIADGRELWVHTVKTPLRDDQGRVSGVLGLFTDITDFKQAEEEKEHLEIQLRQAYKMEAIGTLAGGIAHDFNNILAAMLGYAEIAKDEIPDHNPARQKIEQVIRATYRARDLVQHILAFSRQETQERVPTPIHLIVSDALQLLRALIPTTIEIKPAIDPHCGNIMANATQIHQVVMNICTNAFQAMEEKGGVLKVDLDSARLSRQDLKNDPALTPGLYARLCISDTGSGIAPEYLERIFDPYFTTKKVGQGSGMGLAVAHGIVKTHNGMITVDSQPGMGARFTVLFPVIDAPAPHESEKPAAPSTGDERILVVDDEEVLVNMTREVLERLGYQVTTATSSQAALDLLRSRPQAFDLILTDQTMPGMTGEQLAKALIAVSPDIRIILCTGFSSKIDAGKARALGIKAFIMKPIDPKELSRTIRLVLDGGQ
jgi:PAS domain S-box-containing protein